MLKLIAIAATTWLIMASSIYDFKVPGLEGQDSNSEIKEFCKRNYGVTFPMAEKVSVKGDDTHPLFKYLNAEAKKLGTDDPIQWNFTKFLVDENGKLVQVFASKVTPTSEEITKYLN
jgi:glutathione peroxidase